MWHDNLLFPKPKKLQKKILKQYQFEAWYEYTTCKLLDFILVPYAMIMGQKATHRHSNLSSEQEKRILITLFKPENKKFSEDTAWEQVHAYITIESAYIKRDFSKKKSSHNQITPQELKDWLVQGALVIQRKHRDMSAFKRKLRNGLPKSPEKLLFSKLGRYALNGSTDELWYEETYKDISALFSNFDRKVIASILSATSIRAHLKSNVSKAFKALNQLFKGGNFSGFLEATKLYLQEIRDGKMLTGEINGGGRKIKNFANAMTEDFTAIVVDVWITRSFGCDTKRKFRGKFVSNSPADRTYTAIEYYLVTLGHLLNKRPRGLCASVWSGVRQESDDSSTRYSEALKAKLNHGLFENQYGKLTFEYGKGIFFEEN